MDQPPADATHAILDAIRLIVQELRVASRRSEAELGLSGARLFVMQALGEADRPLSLGALAAKTRTHPSSVSVVVQRLADSGYVTRAPASDDARRAEVKLTAKGRGFLKKTPPTVQERLVRALDGMADDRRLMLAQTLCELVAKADLGHEKIDMFFEDPTTEGPAK